MSARLDYRAAGEVFCSSCSIDSLDVSFSGLLFIWPRVNRHRSCNPCCHVPWRLAPLNMSDDPGLVGLV